MLDGGRERLEVGVPDPRDVSAIGIAIVERGEQARPPTHLEQGADRGVEAGGVLHQDQTQLAPIDRNLLQAAERGSEVGDRKRRGR